MLTISTSLSELPSCQTLCSKESSNAVKFPSCSWHPWFSNIHLGQYVGRDSAVVFQAHKVYEEGASLGLFRSAWQRSLYNVDRLQSWPWWTLKQTGSAEEHFKVCPAFNVDLHLLQCRCFPSMELLSLCF